jgi:hypothetical protein
MNDIDLVNKYGKVIGWEKSHIDTALHWLCIESSFIIFRIYGVTARIILLSDLDLLRNVLIKDSHIFINRRVRHSKFFPLFIKTTFHLRLWKVSKGLLITDLHDWKMTNGKMLDLSFHQHSRLQNSKQ